MKKYWLFFLFFALASNAQKYDFGKVSLEEIQQTKHPLEPEAPAAILYKKVNVRYSYDKNEGFLQITEIVYRIKIYNQEGFDYATQEEILFNDGNIREKVTRVNGSTYNIEDGKVVETKLKKEQVFENKINNNLTELKFTMPNIIANSVIEYKYEITSPFEQSMNAISCQYKIPVNYLDVAISIPEFYIFRPKLKGYYPLVLNVSSEKASYVYDNNLYAIKQANIPSIVIEPFVDNINNYRASLDMEIVGIQYPGKFYKNYSLTWKSVVNSIYQSESFGKELKMKNYFEEELKTAIDSVSESKQKMAAILEFCKNKIKWNDFNSIYSGKGVKEAYKKGVGNSADINLNLINMLNFAGFDANPILVSTKSHGIPLFPTKEGFNYVIAGVELAGNKYLLDATDKFSTVDVIPVRAINWTGRLIKKSGDFEEILLFPKIVSSENNVLSITLKDDNKITGKRRIHSSSYLAKSFRENYINNTKENYLEKLENKYEGITISNHEVTNEIDLNQPVIESYDFEMVNMVEKIGNSLFFSPMFFLATSTNPFKAEKREYPIDFVFPVKSRTTINVNIPEGYVIESIPAPINIAMPDNLGTYRYAIQKTDASVQLVVQYEINNTYITQDYYDAVKDFFKQIVDKEAEKVVLKKS
ncbi:MAG TPA: DUF3857 domain-containing protein [Flavobacterium sp.]|nr:DUF3857 domain-containing protein [Flavobacterium sp.]